MRTWRVWVRGTPLARPVVMGAVDAEAVAVETVVRKVVAAERATTLIKCPVARMGISVGLPTSAPCVARTTDAMRARRRRV